MNYQSAAAVKNGDAAFYAWQCITLQLRTRDVDLVIPNEKDLSCFIDYLVVKMNTVDGRKDSANFIVKAI